MCSQITYFTLPFPSMVKRKVFCLVNEWRSKLFALNKVGFKGRLSRSQSCLIIYTRSGNSRRRLLLSIGERGRWDLPRRTSLVITVEALVSNHLGNSGNPKSGCGRFRELFITKFSKFKRVFIEVVVTRAGRKENFDCIYKERKIWK